MTAQIVDLQTLETVDLLGPTLGYITAPGDGEPCVLRGEIPPGGAVGAHSHADPETFLMLSGSVEALADGEWIRIAPGEVFHIPGDVRHAFRNPSHEPAVMIIVTTARLGRLFREVAELIDEAGADAAPQVFAEAAQRYGHRLG